MIISTERLRCVECEDGQKSRAELCVDLGGRSSIGNKVPMANFCPEIDCLPKLPLCPDHRRKYRKQGGEWTTVTEAAAMIARRAKKTGGGGSGMELPRFQRELMRIYDKK